MQAVQIAALVKDNCLRRIQVLGLGVAHHPASEADNAAVGVHDGEHDPVPELVVGAVLLIDGDEPRLGQDIVAVPLCLQVPVQVIAVLVGVAQAEGQDGLVAQLSLFQIVVGRLSLGSLELGVKIFGRQLVDLQDPGTQVRLLPCRFGVLLLRKLDPCPLCEELQGLHKRIVLVLHQEGKHVASRPAAEAIVHLLIAAH